MNNSKITTLIEMRQAIEQLAARVDAIEEWIAPAQPQSESTQNPLLPIEPPADQYRLPLTPNDAWDSAAKIERHILRNIGRWKWAYITDEGLCCPLSASDVAQRMSWDTNHVRMLIAKPDLWRRVKWTHAPLPEGHPESARCSKAITVVVPEPGLTS